MKDELLAEVPKFNSVKTGLYNDRNKVLGATKLRFINPHDVIIPRKYEKFVLADYLDDGKRLIIFCSTENRKQTSKYRYFFADRTFKSCPKGFKQLYTIHAFDKGTKWVTP